MPAAGAQAEWSRLLRSVLPGPGRVSFLARLRANLDFGSWGVRVVLPILTMIAVGVAVVVIVGANSGAGTQAPPAAALGFPPASLANRDFTAAPGGRGTAQALGRVAAVGTDVVAVGAESGTIIPRAEFFFSPDAGGSWSLATESSSAGGTPPPGHAALLVAGGTRGWVALGPDSVWTSATGAAWTLVSQAGLPGQVNVLRATSAGFMAAGPGAVYVSANGTAWRRYATPAGMLDVRYLAASGDRVVIAGDVVGASGLSGAWRSGDGGRDWTPVPVPRGHGASARITGLAAAGAGFVLIRPARVRGVAATDVYRSADGATWSFATRLAGVTAQALNGDARGAVLAGMAGGVETAFVTQDGVTWRTSLLAGHADQVGGVAMSGDKAIVTLAGVAPGFTVVKPDGATVHVGLSAVPGAAEPQVAVLAVAAHENEQVAVGSANGFPAAWTSTDGGSDWNRATGQTTQVLDRPGEQQLSGVAYGSQGWLAVGGVTGGTAQHPVVIGSADGRIWTAADGEQAFADPGLYTTRAAAGAAGYVIVGYQRQADGGASAVAWWSAGLTGWQRENSVNALDGAGGSRQMLDVTATRMGFAAVGRQGNAPVVWITADGRDWGAQVLPLPDGATRAVLLHVAASKTGVIVALGMSASARGVLSPFAVRSADGGRTWTASRLPVPAGTAQVTALVAAGGGFTATGSFGSTPGHQDVVIWASADGAAWSAAAPGGFGLAGPGIQAITGLTVSGSTLTGVGFTASPASMAPVFWQSPIR